MFSAVGPSEIAAPALNQSDFRSPDTDGLNTGRSAGSAAQYIHELGNLAALLGPVTARDGMLNAICHMVGEDFLLHRAQSGSHCRNLRNDVDAIAVCLDHAGETTDLALDALQAFQRRGLGFRVHSLYIPLGGSWFQGAFQGEPQRSQPRPDGHRSSLRDGGGP